jgi:hypothetical protein
MAKSKPDWIKAKAMYETGKSLRQIADACFIDNSNISKRAKKEGWQPGIKEATSRGIVPLPNILYLITSEEFRANGIYKIGITNDIEFRIKSMQTGCPFKLFAYKAYLHENPLGIEQRGIRKWLNLPINNGQKPKHYMAMVKALEKLKRR